MTYKLRRFADAIASLHALAHHLTLVTHNVREFSRVEGLQWEDWEAER